MSGCDAWAPAVVGAMYGGMLCAHKCLGMRKGLWMIMQVLRAAIGERVRLYPKEGWIWSVITTVRVLTGRITSHDAM